MERRLGRGLGALLGGDVGIPTGDDQVSESRELRTVAIEHVDPNPDQPRKVFASEAMESLRESIVQHGLLQPVCVRAQGDRYRIVAGERRWRAARLAGLAEIPVRVVVGIDEVQALELALVENLQREDLDPMEKARGYRDLIDRAGMTQDQVGARVGMNRATVANHLRLLDLPKEAQEALIAGLVTMGHARALLGAANPKIIPTLLAKIVREELSVREVEALVKDGTQVAAGSSGTKVSGRPTPKQEPWAREFEGRLRSSLGTKVSVTNRKGYKGQIVVHYHDRDELERLMETLAPQDEV
ncbi:MAG TPA: ParB/RepB/Spo0J family partition protein [Planctomycetes bacterium]|nr:ParB/RepB/Spo0J family partition protein [Planctomycetota bacterium]HIK60806.1 ParB/RepB/Spo0J family partition protein [Planctomycetota bacterium]